MGLFARSFSMVFAVAIACAVSVVAAAPKKSQPSSPDLKHLVDDLKKNPSDRALREKIIKLSLTAKPALPEDAERNFVRGTTFLQKARDAAGYKKAIAEFSSAIEDAPWFALAYYNLSLAQEKAGLYADAIENLNFYLLAAPDAKNVREVKNKIYALEADVEILQQRDKAPAPAAAAAPAPAPAAPLKPDASLGVAGAQALPIEPAETSLNILKLPAEKKAKMPSFTGAWYFKDSLRGQELMIEAFEISKNEGGDLVVEPPKRVSDSYATVTKFEISDRTLKLQLRWRMKTVAGYWKLETYELTLSADGKTLTGLHNQKSVGGRDISMDRVLLRQ